jgi:hypothetical protein
VPTEEVEERIFDVEAESRTLYVQPDDTHTGSSYPRTYMVPAEDRTHVVEFSEHG